MSDDRQAGDDAAALAKRKAAAYVGHVVGERYRVEELIALGGMGAVFRAEHVHLRKQVALKLLHPSTENLPELVTRFERESIVGAHVTHHNVCRATDFGRLEDGSHYLVLEYVEGRTLHETLKKGPIEPTRAAEIAAQIAAGLGAAHEIGIVHRDVKPANVMLLDGPEPDAVDVKIVDFGLAKLPPERFHIEEQLSVTSAGTVFGTVAYMAPELARGMQAVDSRSDLYAVGVILYEMLAGKHPFEGADPAAIFRQHVKTAPPPIAKRAPGVSVPPELEAVAKKLLAKDPAGRYPSAASLIEALDAVCPPSQPRIVAPRPSHRGSAGPPSHAAPRDLGPPSDASPQPAAVAAATKAPKPMSGRNGVLVLAAAAAVAAAIVAYRTSSVSTASAVANPVGVPSVSSGNPVGVPQTPPAVSTGNPGRVPQTPPNPTPASALPPAPVAAPAVLSPEAIRLRGVMNEAAAAHDAKHGAAALLALAKLAPDAFRSKDLVAETAAVAVSAAVDPALAGDVFAVLGGPSLGEAGPDVLFYITSFFGGTRGASHATQLLADPAVLARASPALRVARDIKLAPCRDRPGLYDRAAAEGDERALVLLLSMLASDCSGATGGCCAPRDARLGAVTASLKQRLHK